MLVRVQASISDALVQMAAKQLPFAMSKALNDGALAFQKAQIASMSETFTVRRRDFLQKSVKITHFATKSNLVAEIAVESPGGRSDVFGKFEDGGIKHPANGRHFLAIPRVGSFVKPRARSIVDDQHRPAALLKNPLLSMRTFVKPFKNDPSQLGIFAVDRVHEARLGASRRSGKVSKRDLRRARPMLLFTLEAQAPIPADLHFELNAERVINGRWAFDFERRWLEATKTAR